MHDGSRDFSLYILDPFESQSAPNGTVFTSQGSDTRSVGCSEGNTSGAPSAQQSRGVAVGLGLMSWALSTHRDAASATVNLVKGNTGHIGLALLFFLIRGCLPAWF